VLACLAGEVPDLLGADDIEEIGNALRPSMAAAGLPVTKMSIYSFFVSRCVWAGAGLRECQTRQWVHLLPDIQCIVSVLRQVVESALGRC